MKLIEKLRYMHSAWWTETWSVIFLLASCLLLLSGAQKSQEVVSTKTTQQRRTGTLAKCGRQQQVPSKDNSGILFWVYPSLMMEFWFAVSNMLFVESPAGVGFSYSNHTKDFVTGDERTGEELRLCTFLKLKSETLVQALSKM